jgi:hypothetical protein
MEEAEASWKAVLKRETIASLSADLFFTRPFFLESSSSKK